MNELNDTIIELKDINKTYTVNEEKETVLQSLFFGFERGLKTSIIGSSGCGKTTILNIIGGVETSFEGEVYYNNQPITDFDKFRRENISYIFQDLNLVKHLTLVENIKIGLTNDVENKTDRALELLKRVGLEDHSNKRPLQLSGGEKQRVAIARALARDTDILLCDEPTGSLDKKMKFEIMDLIMSVFEDKTVIFVTHDMDIASKYSNQVLGIENGKLVVKEQKPVELKSVTPVIQPNEKIEKTFENRYISNLLFNKFSLINSSYLIIVIAAIFMFGIGAIKGVEREVDDYMIDMYKTDLFLIGNPGFSYDGMEDNMEEFNSNYREDMDGFIVGILFDTQFDEVESDHAYFLNILQDSVKDNLESDLVAGRYPENTDELLYSIGSARVMIYDYYVQSLVDEEEINDLFDRVEGYSNQELFDELKTIEISYKNTYRFNEERLYNEDLTVVGIIDDFSYISLDVHSRENVERWNHYGINVNQYLTIEYQGEEKSQAVNTNIYMIEEEFKTFMSTVYIGLNSHSFHYVQIVIDEEDLDKREYVFDKFLVSKPLFTGRDHITDERHEYYDDMFGYKVSILGGCALLGILGLVSLFNGIKSSVDKYKRDIGIYRTLGYTSKNIRRMFFIEGTIISIVIIGSVIGLWGILNVVLNESIVHALDPNNLVKVNQIIHFDIISAISIVLLVEFIVLISINKQLKEVSIIELIRNK